jgi:hypothetical protein
LLYLTSAANADGSSGRPLDLWSVDTDGNDKHLVRPNVATYEQLVRGRLYTDPVVPGALPRGATFGADGRSAELPSPDGAFIARWAVGIDSAIICVRGVDETLSFDHGCTYDYGYYGLPVWQP